MRFGVAVAEEGQRPIRVCHRGFGEVLDAREPRPWKVLMRGVRRHETVIARLLNAQHSGVFSVRFEPKHAEAFEAATSMEVEVRERVS